MNHLWQVQLAGDKSAFGFQLSATAKEALLHHPHPDVRTLEDLERVLQVRLLLGGPAVSGPSDPDRVGFVNWQLVLYSNGLVGALNFIQFILEYKVQKKMLASMPELFVRVMDPGGAPLSPPWRKFTDTSLVLPGLFNALPPKGRRHVLAQLEIREASEDFEADKENRDLQSQNLHDSEPSDISYFLTFFGGIYFFRDRFEDKGVPGDLVVINSDGDSDYVRYVEFKMEAASMERVLEVLQDVLKKMPIYFINMAGESDPMAAWLVQQASIIPCEALADP